jgi:F-type H+-transporting ATPase subunit b
MSCELFNLILAAEEKSGLFTADQLAGYLVTALFTAINLIVAYIIIKKLVYKRVIAAMREREDALNSELESAEKANAEATKTAEESSQIIDDAKVQASVVIEEAKDNAEKQAEAIIQNAKDEAEIIITRAQEDAEKLKRSSIEDMKDDISDLAVQVAEHVLGEAIPHEHLVSMAKKHTDEVVGAEVKQNG